MLFEPRSWIFFEPLICRTGQNPSLTYLIIDSYIDFSTFLLLLCSTCVFARLASETRRKRDHSEGQKKGEHYGVSPFSGDDVDFCAGLVRELEVRASERASRARPRMREICFFL